MLRLYQHLTGDALETPGSAYVFHALHSAKLREPVPLTEYTNVKSRGFVVVVEEHRGPRLLQRLQAEAVAGPWWPGAAPHVALRLPAPYRDLILAGVWITFVLPDLPSQGRWGARPAFLSVGGICSSASLS